MLERCRVKMQKDFEQWLTVMIKHKQTSGQAMASGVPASNPAPKQNLASTDKRVSDNLKDFYAARDAIYSDMAKGQQ